MLLVVSCVGCAAPWLPEYDVATFERYRVDVLDGNNIWGPVRASGESVPGEVALVTPKLVDTSRNSALSSSRAVSTNQSASGGPVSPINGSFGLTQNAIYSSFSQYGFRDQLLASESGFNDLHLFNIRFASLESRTFTQSRGTQVERVIRFSEAKKSEAETEQRGKGDLRTYVDFSYGARYLLVDESFDFGGTGNLTGNIASNTNVTNRSFGPQIGLHATTMRNGWQFLTGGYLMIGAVSQEANQQSANGQILLPSNSLFPLFSGPIPSERYENGTKAAGIAEAVAQASYQLSEQLAVQLGYSVIVLGNIRSAEDSVQYILPTFELNSTGVYRRLKIDSLFARAEYRW